MHIDLIVTIAVAIFGSTGFWTWLLNRNKKKSDESKLLLGLAYSEIIARCEQYIDRGYVSTDEYNELYRYLYEPYHNMGGNGTAERMMGEVEKLPTQRGEKHEQQSV